MRQGVGLLVTLLTGLALVLAAWGSTQTAVDAQSVSTPTLTPTPSPTSSVPATQTAVAALTLTALTSPSTTATLTPTMTPTLTPTITPTPSATSTSPATQTAVAAATETATAAITATTTLTPTVTRTPTVTLTPTVTPTQGPTNTPTPVPTPLPVPPPTLIVPPTITVLGQTAFLGPSNSAMTWVLPSSLTGLVTISVPPAIFAALGPGQQVEAVYNPAPPLTDDEIAASQGGGQIQSLGSPISLSVFVRDVSGAILPFPDSVQDQPITVSLTVQANPSQGDFAWLRGLQLYETFAGYVRDTATFDGTSNSLALQVPARALSDVDGTLFLPVVLQPWWVQPIDPDVHVWSGPTVDDTDLGAVGREDIILPVVGTQALGRIYVYDPDLGGNVWIDGRGVAPSGPPPAPGS